jgi:dTDP-4-dehydrorhamnose reductase
MRILILGKIGQLGWELLRTTASLGEVTALDYPEIDLSNAQQVSAAVRQARPQVIINATAYTDVDKAEKEEAKAMAINASGPGLLAQEARRLEAVLVHYSTDYVFDGVLGKPYVESDAPNALGVYARSKLEGEQRIQEAGGQYLIFRTAWLYSTRRPSFVTKVLAWSRQQEVLKVVDDQVSNPTWARLLAEITAQVLAMGSADLPGFMGEKGGLYHLAGKGHASRLEWARAILELDPNRGKKVTRELLAAKTADFPTPAERPLFSALCSDKFEETFGLRIPEWRDTLHQAME